MSMRQLLSVDTCEGQLSGSECDSIVVSRITASVLAVLGCSFVVGMIVLFKTYHNYGQRLILNLTIAAFLNTAPYFMGRQRDSFGCTAQAFIITWFNWNVLVWVLCITHKLGLNILREDAGERWERTYHLCGWGIGLVFAIIPLAMDMYGPSGVWCWVKDNEDATTALRFGIWYVPLWIGIVILSVANFSIIRNVRKRERRWEGTYNPDVVAEKEFLRAQVAPIKWYPLVYMACMVFPTVNRIQNAASPDQPVFSLLLLHSLSSPLQGLINSVIYAYNTDAATWKQCTPAGIRRALRFRRGGSVGNFNSQPLVDNQPGRELSNDSDGDSDDNLGDH
eukprot:m.98768 g.98768  ORF g.98768 m.98768 type:complete len:336 (+) comp12442_c0_seq4:128-1135(+)